MTCLSVIEKLLILVDEGELQDIDIVSDGKSGLEEEKIVIFFRRGQGETVVNLVVNVVPLVVVFTLVAVLRVMLTSQVVRLGGMRGFRMLSQAGLAGEHLSTVVTFQLFLRLGLGIMLKQKHQSNINPIPIWFRLIGLQTKKVCDKNHIVVEFF